MSQNGAARSGLGFAESPQEAEPVKLNWRLRESLSKLGGLKVLRSASAQRPFIMKILRLSSG